MEDKMKDKLWLVEWVPDYWFYRVSRYAEPSRTVAYEDNWQDAVEDIRANYGIDGVIIFITKPNGEVSYWCEPDYL